MFSSSSTTTDNLAARARMRNPIHPSRLLPHQQMLREGPVPRAPGERELDFYEQMTPRNQRLTQLYVFAMIGSSAGVAMLLWGLTLIKTEILFSDDAKKHLLAPYSWTGYSLIIAIFVATILFSGANISRIVTIESPLPEIYAASGFGALSTLLIIFGMLSYSMTVNIPEASDGSPYDVCTAPGADPWKRLPCGAANNKRFLVQMGGLTSTGITAILCFTLFVLHVSESRNQRGQGGMFARSRGYARLHLDPYEVQDEDDEPSVHLK